MYSFEPAYEHLTIIETQPAIKEIIERDEVETAQKWRGVAEQNLPPEDLERIVNKINRSSLSYYYAEIHRDVYVQRNNYKNSVIPLKRVSHSSYFRTPPPKTEKWLNTNSKVRIRCSNRHPKTLILKKGAQERTRTSMP